MEIFKKNKLNISSIEIRYNNETNKKEPQFIKNWLNEPESINKSHNGYFIKCGKINNITVIDIDDLTLEHNLKLIKLIDLKCPTLTEGTNKGIHFYFKYNKELKSSVDSTLKIDYLNDNKCVFCAPTKIITNDKIIEYKILLDVKINELHSDVLNYLTFLKANKIIKNDNKIKISKEKKYKYKENYYISPNELGIKLNKLDKDYLNDYEK